MSLSRVLPSFYLILFIVARCGLRIYNCGVSGGAFFMNKSFRIFIFLGASVLLVFYLLGIAGCGSVVEKTAPQVGIYYVAPGGSDSNPGTAALPWRTIKKAADTLVTGETVYIRAGMYKERVIPKNSGTSGKYINYESYSRETVTIEGSGVPVPADEGLFDLSGKSYVRVSGFKIMNSQYAGIYADGSSNLIIEKNYTYNSASSGIGIWGSNNIIISSNEVASSCSNGWQESITVAGTNLFEVKNNLVHNEISGYNKEGICLKDGSSNGKVYKNYVHHIFKVGIYVDAWNKHTYNIDVFQNITCNTSNDGITTASEMGGSLEGITIYNNITCGNSFLGISISANGTSLTHPMKNIKIINNTAYNNGNGPLNWGGGIAIGNPDARDVVIRNNICSQNLSFQIAGVSVAPTGEVTIDHNLIDGYRGDVADGETRGSAYVEGDPQFVNAFDLDFYLKSSSPAINSGSSLDAPNFDFDGTSRPQGSGYDIGAFEFK